MDTPDSTPSLHRRLAVPAAVAAALVAGAVAGSTFGFLGVSSAQDEPSTTTTVAPDPGDGTTDDGATTDDGTTDDGAECDHELGGHGHGPGFGPLGAALDTAAEVLGLTTDEVRTALQDGSTLADLATQQGVEVQALVDALVAEAQGRLDEAVTAGDLEQAQADEIAAELTERITALVDGEGPMGGPGFGGPGFGGPGFGGPGRPHHGDGSTDDGATDDGATDGATEPSSGGAGDAGTIGA